MLETRMGNKWNSPNSNESPNSLQSVAFADYIYILYFEFRRTFEVSHEMQVFLALGSNIGEFPRNEVMVRESAETFVYCPFEIT